MSRLLYVATTRAADYLILSSGLEDLDRSRGPWMELLRRQFDLAAGRLSRISHGYWRRSSATNRRCRENCPDGDTPRLAEDH